MVHALAHIPSFAKAARGAKRARVENVEEYEECNWIPSKSNIVERQLTLGTTRKHMDTESLQNDDGQQEPLVVKSFS